MAGSAVPLAQICILQFDKGPGGMLQTPAGRRGFLCVAKALHGLLAASAALTACGGGSASGSAGASVSNGVHEPIRICAPSRSVKDLIDVVHKYYPEIVFNVDAYSGPNGTIYMQDQLEADCQADVYSITYTARRLRHDPDGHADAGDGRSGSHPCHPAAAKTRWARRSLP